MALIDKLIAAWRLNNDYTDAVGANDGTAMGSAGFDGTIKKLGSHSVLCNAGGTDAVNFGDVLDATFAAVDGKYSFSIWVYPTNIASNPVVFSKAELTVTGFWGRIMSTGLFSFLIGFSGSASRTYNATDQEISTDEWTHIVVTYDGSLDTNDGLDRVKIYINNSEAALSLVTSGALTDIPDTTNRLAVGGVITNTGTSVTLPFIGNLDEFEIFNDVLSAAEVSALWNGEWDGAVSFQYC
jgi:hypothetical protein